MYGEGATYDSIEGRFRIVRKEAEKLKTEIENGARQPAPARGTGEKRSPRKPRQHSTIDLDSVESGRIEKSPTKKRRTKKDVLEASTSTSSSGDASHSGSNSHNEADGYLPATDPTTADFSFMESVMSGSFGTQPDFNLVNDDQQWFNDFGEPEEYA